MKTKDFLLEPEPQQKLKFSDHYRQMWPFVKPYWIRALLAILICIPVGALDSVIALALKPYMDNVLVDKNTASPIYIPVLIVAFTTVQGFLNYAATYLNTWVGTRINHDLKRALFKKLMSFEPSFFDRNPSGVIIQRFAGDADTACLGLLDNLKLFVSRFFSSLSLIAVLIYNSWQLSIIAIVVLLCALLPLTQVKRRIKGLIKDTINRSSCILTHYNECHAGSKTIASYNLQERMYGQFNEILRTLFKLTMKMVKKTGWMTPLMHVVVSIGVGAVIGYGSYLIVNGTITSGNFVSFITALIMLYTPIKGIGKNFNNVQISFLAIERITDVLELESDIKDKDNALELKTVQKEIKFDHVNFEYQENVPVLRDICLNVKAGSTVALVGNSGGGKTTIVNLLPRFTTSKAAVCPLTEPTSATIRCNRCATKSPSFSRTTSCFRAPSATTSCSANRTPATKKFKRRSKWPISTTLSANTKRVWTATSANADRRSPADSGSGWQLPARWSKMRRSSFWTKRPRPLTTARKRWCRRQLTT